MGVGRVESGAEWEATECGGMEGAERSWRVGCEPGQARCCCVRHSGVVDWVS